VQILKFFRTSPHISRVFTPPAPSDFASQDAVSSIDWTHWVPTLRATLLFIIQGDEVLLIRKKRGLGAGKMNGPGGKIEPGESSEACAIRETQEEIGVTPSAVTLCGVLRFHFADGLRLWCAVYRADAFTGVPIETEEAIPHWTPVAQMPYAEMWADDPLWFPYVVSRQKFTGNFTFDDEIMTSHDVTLTPGLTSAD
jgi:8-oxo-dGTP diphosphatase